MMGNWSNWDFFSWGIGPMPGWLAIVGVWSLIWQGMALWKSARNGDRYWFLALLLVHTAGILDILYLFVFAKNKLVLISEPTTAPRKKKK